MGGIIVTIGGYHISQVGHRVVYIMGRTWRYYSYRQEALHCKRIKKISSPCWRSGIIRPWKRSKRKSQSGYGRAYMTLTRSAGRNGNGYHAPGMYPPRRNGCAILWNG